MGFDLKAWTQKPGKRFIFNEFGLGGGISECGDTPARNREEAGRFSWLGGTSTYTRAIDPWKDPVISQFNKDFYKVGGAKGACSGEGGGGGLYAWGGCSSRGRGGKQPGGARRERGRAVFEAAGRSTGTDKHAARNAHNTLN